jgi:hypothetical protein
MRLQRRWASLISASMTAAVLAVGLSAAAGLMHPADVSANFAALAEAEAVDDAREIALLGEVDALGVLDEESFAQFAAPVNEPLFSEMARLDELLIDDDGVITNLGSGRAREIAALRAARATVLAARHAARASLLTALRARNARCGAQPGQNLGANAASALDPCRDAYRQALEDYGVAIDRISSIARGLYEQAQDHRRQAEERHRCANALWEARQICLAESHHTSAPASRLSQIARCLHDDGSVACVDQFRQLLAERTAAAEIGRVMCREARVQAARVCELSPIRFH